MDRIPDKLTWLLFALAAPLAPMVGCTTLEPGTDIRALDMSSSDLGNDRPDRSDLGTEPDGSVPRDLGRPDASVPDMGTIERDMGPTGCPPPGTRPEMRLGATDVTTDTTWDCQFDWVLEGNVVVTDSTLRIQPGTSVRAADGVFVLIARTARIEAEGTPEAPIVLGPLTHPARRGQWRGLVMLGSARTVFASTTEVGGTLSDERGDFGGVDDAHDCGRLSYVRIEHAGGETNDYFIPAGGLTLAGCGRGTRIDHVQVHRSTDGIGLIGGTVPLSRVIVTDSEEDGIEWAAGYRGLIQFPIVQSFWGSGAALKGNRREGETSGDPESAPLVFNATLVGGRSSLEGRPPNGFETGILFQAGSLGFVRSSFVQGFEGWWANVGDDSTGPRLLAGMGGITHTAFAGAGDLPDDGTEDEDGGFDEEAFVRGGAGNRIGIATLLRDPFVEGPASPDLTGPSDLSSGSFPSPPTGWDGVYEAADYYGAIRGSGGTPEERARVDWTLGWTTFPID